MRKTCFLLVFFFTGGLVKSQNISLEENLPASYNGLDYGYYITNEKSKEVKGEDYDRFEINLYVVNKTGGMKIFPFTSNASGNEDEIAVAEFTCMNATGKRLTAKSGKVNAKPWFTIVKIPDDNPSSKSKYKMTTAQVGFAIRNGQTINNKIIVIVPRGERPKFSCRPAYFPE